MAYRLTFANPEATLTDEEINQAMSKITRARRITTSRNSLVPLL